MSNKLWTARLNINRDVLTGQLFVKMKYTLTRIDPQYPCILYYIIQWNQINKNMLHIPDLSERGRRVHIYPNLTLIVFYSGYRCGRAQGRCTSVKVDEINWDSTQYRNINSMSLSFSFFIFVHRPRFLKVQSTERPALMIAWMSVAQGNEDGLWTIYTETAVQ